MSQLFRLSVVMSITAISSSGSRIVSIAGSRFFAQSSSKPIIAAKYALLIASDSWIIWSPSASSARDRFYGASDTNAHRSVKKWHTAMDVEAIYRLPATRSTHYHYLGQFVSEFLFARQFARRLSDRTPRERSVLHRSSWR